MEGVDPALAGGVSVHHAVIPEIEIVDDYNARGTWEMEDAICFPPGSKGLRVPAKFKARAFITRLTCAGTTLGSLPPFDCPD
jgi:hypothetical protein